MRGRLRSGQEEPVKATRAVKEYFEARASSGGASEARQEGNRPLMVRLMNERVQGDILELGCGMAPSLSARPGQDRVVAMDLSTASLRHVAGVWARVCGDAGGMPFLRERFDGAVSAHVFHHLAGRNASETRQLLVAVVGELARVVRPRGTVAVADTVLAGPFFWAERPLFGLVRVASWLFRAPAVIFRGVRSLETAFARGGFQVNEVLPIPTSNKPLTPWKSSLRWPMAWSPLRDVMLILQRVE